MIRGLRVLIVAYAFPPVGGVGVQRATKLAKFLPELGCDVSVLTVANPSVPLSDDSYAADVALATVHRARTLEPGYAVKKASWEATANQQTSPGLKARAVAAGVGVARQMLLPDPQVLWFPHAAMKMRQLAREHDVVLITAPPFSQFLLGPVAKMSGTPVVLDYRDEWSTLRSSYEMLEGSLPTFVGGNMEKQLVRTANRIVTATEAFRENLLREFPFLRVEHIVTIPNGYDPDDYPAKPREPSRERMRLAYAGTVYKLTSARGLIGAIRRLHDREPDLAKLLEVQFMGRIVDTELDYFEGTEALGVHRAGFLPHDEVLRRMGESHLTLIIVEDAPGCERIYPAKTFELMHLGRPILTLAPEGELTRLVRRLSLGDVVHPHDEAAICEALERALRAFRDSDGAVVDPGFDEEGVAEFHRRELAKRFATVLRDAAGAA